MSASQRRRLHVSGRVQGVGFRPTVFRYAGEMGLGGYVKNTPSGVVIEVEGEAPALDAFLEKLKRRPPRQARVEAIIAEEIPPREETGFRIEKSRRSGDLLAGLPPDLATCEECRTELLSPAGRRRHYPFINCTNCGPRFTIIEALPYDRPSTSMAGFAMCPECQAEYENPSDRRFDAQPNACPRCGPSLRLTGPRGHETPGAPLEQTVKMLREGEIAAIKGLGGYHLACDALNDKAAALLRQRKNRPAKALAVMFRDVEQCREHCRLNETEEAALLSAARPIVILHRRKESTLSSLISPDTRDTGAFLPYTPLHILLLRKISPLVMTSGNAAGEPIAKDEEELRRLLSGIADTALAHNRPILRRCDDSVLKITHAQTLFFRRSRGYVPDPITLPFEGPPVLACGADVKNAFCLTRGAQAILSQHIGDLSDYRARCFYKEQIGDFKRLWKTAPAAAAHDLHPGYFSTRYALKLEGVRRIPVQHHHAHIAACMAEHGLRERVLGAAFDGSGYGPDGTVWGGEFLIADCRQYRRAARFKLYRLPGGEEAIRQPGRMAISVLLTETENVPEKQAAQLMPDLSQNERGAVARMVLQGFRSPWTSSCGRLFDAAAALLGLCDSASYEGRPAVRLQTLAETAGGTYRPYPFEINQKDELRELSFGPMIRDMIRDIETGGEKPVIAARFHATVAEAAAEMCRRLRGESQLKKVVLSGGVFQNSLLLGLLKDRLRDDGFAVYSHHRVPPNDGGIALGQAAVALARPQTQEVKHVPGGAIANH